MTKINEELIPLKRKLKELDDEKIESVIGGNINDFTSKKDINFDLIPAFGSKPDITKRIVIGGALRSVFVDNPTTSTFTDESIEDNKNEFLTETKK